MIVVFIGIPGAGKGTIAQSLKSDYGFKHLSTGDILRSEVSSGSTLGKEVSNILAEGGLVSDDIMINIIKKKLSDANDKYILDGFPRTKNQATSLDQIATVDRVLFIHLSDEDALNRLLNRVDEKGNKRKDDKEDVIRERIKLFHEQFDALLEHYKSQGLVTEIDGSGSIEEVFSRIKKGLNLD